MDASYGNSSDDSAGNARQFCDIFGTVNSPLVLILPGKDLHWTIFSVGGNDSTSSLFVAQVYWTWRT